MSMVSIAPCSWAIFWSRFIAATSRWARARGRRLMSNQGRREMSVSCVIVGPSLSGGAQVGRNGFGLRDDGLDEVRVVAEARSEQVQDRTHGVGERRGRGGLLERRRSWVLERAPRPRRCKTQPATAVAQPVGTRPA